MSPRRKRQPRVRVLQVKGQTITVERRAISKSRPPEDAWPEPKPVKKPPKVKPKRRRSRMPSLPRERVDLKTEPRYGQPPKTAKPRARLPLEPTPTPKPADGSLTKRSQVGRTSFAPYETWRGR